MIYFYCTIIVFIYAKCKILLFILPGLGSINLTHGYRGFPSSQTTVIFWQALKIDPDPPSRTIITIVSFSGPHYKSLRLRAPQNPPQNVKQSEVQIEMSRWKNWSTEWAVCVWRYILFLWIAYSLFHILPPNKLWKRDKKVLLVTDFISIKTNYTLKTKWWISKSIEMISQAQFLSWMSKRMILDCMVLL